MSQEEVEITIILEKQFFLNIGPDTHLLYWSLPGNKAVFDVAMSGNEKRYLASASTGQIDGSHGLE